MSFQENLAIALNPKNDNEGEAAFRRIISEDGRMNDVLAGVLRRDSTSEVVRKLASDKLGVASPRVNAWKWRLVPLVVLSAAALIVFFVSQLLLAKIDGGPLKRNGSLWGAKNTVIVADVTFFNQKTGAAIPSLTHVHYTATETKDMLILTLADNKKANETIKVRLSCPSEDVQHGVQYRTTWIASAQSNGAYPNGNTSFYRDGTSGLTINLLNGGTTRAFAHIDLTSSSN